MVGKELAEKVRDVSIRLYMRGAELAQKAGLLFIDTKYEFGLIDDELLLIDEVHTPDSSRFWYASEYESRFARGEPQRQLDKEYLRRWLMERGFMGEGEPPSIPDDVRIETGHRYLETYEAITGEGFVPRAGSAEEEAATLRAWRAWRAGGAWREKLR